MTSYVGPGQLNGGSPTVWNDEEVESKSSKLRLFHELIAISNLVHPRRPPPTDFLDQRYSQNEKVPSSLVSINSFSGVRVALLRACA